MPTKNIVKIYGEGHYYHAYNRGVDRMDIFREPSDYFYFMSLMKRHLSSEQVEDKRGRPVPNYCERVELVAFCLMPNHYHLLFYLKERDGIEKFMRSGMTAYSRYFNTKYHRLGTLFQNHFLAARITNEAYFWHITRYIHLNPTDIGQDWRRYQYSSLPYFLGDRAAEWIHPEHIIDDDRVGAYLDFLADYEDAEQTLSDIKDELAAT